MLTGPQDRYYNMQGNIASLAGRGNILQSFSNEQFGKIKLQMGKEAILDRQSPFLTLSPGGPTTLPYLEIIIDSLVQTLKCSRFCFNKKTSSIIDGNTDHYGYLKEGEIYR